MTEKSVVHIDMDAFFASIEQQVNPALRGKPVIVGGRNNKQRSIICAASYEAKARGIKNAMPSWRALQICPEAIFVPADTAKYLYTSNEIFTILKAFTPNIEKFSIDEFFMNVDACQKLWGTPRDIGYRIKQRVKDRFGLTCTVGIAPTKITAKLAAKMRKPDGLYAINKSQALSLLKHLPVEKLCGIGQRLKVRFNRLGIHTCGELGAYPADLLQEHFGVTGIWLKNNCLVEGLDTRIKEYSPQQLPVPKSVGHSQTLREVTDDQAYIAGWIYLLSEMVAQRLRQQNLQGRTVHFSVSDGFAQGLSKQKTFIEPTYDGYEIYQRCRHIIQRLNQHCLIARVLHVSVSHLQPAQDYYLLQESIKRDRLMRSVDVVNHRYGPWTVCPASLKRAVY